MSSEARRKYGAILPITTSDGRNGITASCSSVPFCRSFTSPMLVTSMPMNVRIRPMIPGIMTQLVFRSGLKRISESTRSPSCATKTFAD
jgi:hypothetical protein